MYFVVGVLDQRILVGLEVLTYTYNPHVSTTRQKIRHKARTSTSFPSNPARGEMGRSSTLRAAASQAPAQ